MKKNREKKDKMCKKKQVSNDQFSDRTRWEDEWGHMGAVAR